MQAEKKSNKSTTSLFTKIFGSTFRRMKIYYVNNTGTSKCIFLLLILLALYYFFWSNFMKSKSLGYVGYRYDQPDEHWMSDDEVQQYLNNLEDTRPPHCLNQAFDFNNMYELKETVSIIMHFHGKHDLGHFKLAISAIIDHTPFDLYENIVVIDDGTKDSEYQQKVTKFLSSPRFSKVKVYRSEKYEGVAATRLKASLIAQGSILVFVSSDVIVNEGWVQPLISSIVGEEKTIVVPHYDNMLSGHRFFKTDDSLTNTFSWSLYTVAFESLQGENEEFLKTSVLRGEVLAVKKSFLTEIGNYDDHFEADGGGENLELSIRAWLCGGSIKVAKCSRVAVHSSLRPLSIKSLFNYQYLAELWFLDDYKNIAYLQGNVTNILKEEVTGALIERKNYFKSNNIQCKDFNWYLTYVAKEIIVPSENFVKFGKLKTKAAFCIRALSEVDVEMSLCRHHIYDKDMMFEMDNNGAIFKGDSCLSLDTTGKETGITNKLILATCQDGSQKQVWQFFGTSLSLSARPNLCLTQVSERDKGTNELKYYAKLKECSELESRMQIWEFLNY